MSAKLAAGDYVSDGYHEIPGRIARIQGEWAEVNWPRGPLTTWRMTSTLTRAAAPAQHRARHWFKQGMWRLSCTAPGCTFSTGSWSSQRLARQEFKDHRAKMGDQKARYPELETLACKIPPDTKELFLTFAEERNLTASQALRLAVATWMQLQE